MTIRKTLQGMLRRDATAPEGSALNFDEFDAVNWLLLLRAREMRKKAVLCDLLARDQTNQSGNVLLQSERDAILHVIMGGCLDDALATGDDGGDQPVVEGLPYPNPDEAMGSALEDAGEGLAVKNERRWCREMHGV